jgi:DNA-binding winged helix-turn-helix (wHTH) protein
MELTLYSFDAYVLDPTEQTLSRAGCRVPLTPKAFATLLMLVQRSGQVVHKDDLMKSIWGDVCVEEANLTQNIFTLRRIFAEGIDGKKYIETVPRLGYRFIASVSQIQRGPRTIPLLHSEKEQPKKSIAVVSFGHSDDDTQFEFLADGMVESIINSLSELPQLRVMAWSAVARYKGKNKDAREIGAELGVTNVLSARLRHINTKLMISAELLDVIDGWHLWGDAFSCDAHGLTEVQEQIAKKISDALKLKLTVDERERLAKRYT